MKAKAGSNGRRRSSGAGYGLKVSPSDRDAHFDPNWRAVTLRIGEREVTVSISPSFWRGCSELRSREIGKYLLTNGLAPWPKWAPPTFDLVPEGEAAFRLISR